MKKLLLRMPILFVSLTFFLTGCTNLMDMFKDPPVTVREISIRVDPSANNNSATRVDLVVLYDQSLIKEFIGLAAQDYFKKYNQLSRDYPGVQVMRWEMVPGQELPPKRLRFSRGTPQAAIIFADYHTPGQHRFAIGKGKGVKVHLKEADFTVEVK